jgi:hypothetical protein
LCTPKEQGKALRDSEGAARALEPVNCTCVGKPRITACHFRPQKMDRVWSPGFDASRNSLQTQEAYMLKIDRSANGRIVFTLSGRIEADDIKQLQQLLASEAPGKQLVWNLRNVTLVNQDAVKFLARCEADSVTLENCPGYIRAWIEQAKGRIRHRPKR